MLIERKEYMKQLSAWQDKQLIKVITGVRRCGKSVLLDMYIAQLKAQGVPEERIIHINLEDLDFISLCQPMALHSYVKERLSKEAMTYVFIDEVQLCSEFPRVVDSLYLRPNIDIYITGSNASLLSHELATMLSGRYVEIKMLPFSFKEFVQARPPLTDYQRLYREYTSGSSFPYALELSGAVNELDVYLDGLYNTIFVKDIMQRRGIQEPMILDSVAKFVFSCIGSELSIKRIADTLTSNGRKSDNKTIEKYLVALTESFIIYRAERYDIKGKQLLKTQEKYYAVDIGLRRHLLGGHYQDVGHILENVVYLELLRRGGKVWVGKIGPLEVDFVVEKPQGLEYYQVSASVRDSTILARELAPLEKIRDHHPKYLLTLDEDPDDNINGIRKLNVLDWLLQ
jgi:uncharacterized protein